jgi:hypothetical protein
MGKLLPGKKQFTIRGANREVTESWTKPTLDWKAYVVCRSCNNTWMSAIENDHAKPSLSDLILGKVDIPIDRSRANSIALFAFKTAVVLDQLARDREPFFERSVRHEFRKSLTIPTNVRMWLAGFLPSGSGEICPAYHEGQLSPEKRIEMYVCTYTVERIVIQVVAYKQWGLRGFGGVEPNSNFSAIPLWPDIPDGFVWPPADILRTVADLNAFTDRWIKVDLISDAPR